jgi:hypothetical protein
VKRPWLAKQIEAELARPDCRFLLLTAEPGAGKTAFMAWLAQQHTDWCRYFIRRDQRTPFKDVGAHSFLLQTGFQLVAKNPNLFNLEQVKITIEQRIGKADANSEIVGAKIEEIVASPFYQKVIEIQQQVRDNQGQIAGVRIGKWYADNRSIPLNNLQYMALFDPATSMLKREQKDQIVVLVDALDEMSYHDSQENLVTWLANCPELPSNLRFVLTSRPDDGLLRIFRGLQQSCIREMTINADDPSVKDDLSTYTRSLVEINNVQVALKTINQESETFVRQAVEQANGNFGYMDAIGRAIDQVIVEKDEQYLIELLNLSSLPKTLEGLYGFFLTRINSIVNKNKIKIKDPQTREIHYLAVWENVYRPILGVLSVAREPLTPEQIQKFASIPGNWGNLIDAIERLCQFLDKLGDRYRLYHSTFPEFLTSPKTKQTDYAFCYMDAIEQNQNIVDYYRANAKSWDEVDWQKKDINNYGLLYLPIHLHTAGWKEHLYTLLTDSPKWMEEKFKALNDDTAYVDDLELAIGDFQDPLQPDELLTLVKLYTARQVVHQKLIWYDDTDLETLVWLGRKDEALRHAYLRSDNDIKFNALLCIYCALKEKGQPDATILDKAKDVAFKIESDRQRTEALIRLAVVLIHSDCANKAKDILKEAEIVADKIHDKQEKQGVLRGLVAAYAQAGDFKKAQEFVAKINNELEKAIALSEFAIAYARTRDFIKARKIAREIQNVWWQAQTLSKLVEVLVQFNNFTQAKRLITEISENNNRVEALSKLAKAFTQVGKAKQAKSIFDKIEKLVDTEEKDFDIKPNYFLYRNQQRQEKMSKFAVALAEAGYEERAKEVVNKIEGRQRADTWIELAAAIAQITGTKQASIVFEQALEVVYEIKDDWERAKLLGRLARDLAKARCIDKANEVFANVRNIPHEIEKDEQQIKVLIKLSIVLTQAGYHTEANMLSNKVKEITHTNLNDLEQEACRELEEANSCMFDSSLSVLQSKEDMAVAYAQAGDFAEGIKIASTIEDYWERLAALSKLATIFAQRGHFELALKTLGLKGRPSEVLTTFLEWMPAFQKIETKPEQELCIKILWEAIGIFGWIYANWYEVDTKFTSHNKS